MNDIQIDIRFEGEKFSPSKFISLSGLPLEIVAEYGLPAKRGRYKGKPSPYGMALLKIEPSDKFENHTDSLLRNLKILLQHKQNFQVVGIETIVVDIDGPNSGEVNLPTNLVSIMSELNAKLDINTFHERKIESTIHDIILFIDKNIILNDEAKQKLSNRKVMDRLNKILENRDANNDSNKLFAIRYLLLYLHKSEQNEELVSLSDIDQVLD